MSATHRSSTLGPKLEVRRDQARAENHRRRRRRTRPSFVQRVGRLLNPQH